LLREVPGLVAVEPVVDAVADGGEAAQLARGEDVDEVVGDGLEVPGRPATATYHHRTDG